MSSTHVVNAHDTFLRMLADSLRDANGAAIPIKDIRYSATDATAMVLQTNCVNVTFMTSSFDTATPSSIMASIDICHNDQLMAMDWEERVAKLLQESAFMQMQDFSVNPAAPTTLTQRIYWPSKVSFRPIVADSYYHSSATITLAFS